MSRLMRSLVDRSMEWQFPLNLLRQRLGYSNLVDSSLANIMRSKDQHLPRFLLKISNQSHFIEISTIARVSRPLFEGSD